MAREGSLECLCRNQMRERIGIDITTPKNAVYGYWKKFEACNYSIEAIVDVCF